MKFMVDVLSYAKGFCSKSSSIIGTGSSKVKVAVVEYYIEKFCWWIDSQFICIICKIGYLL